ncbi:MAG: ferrochelatase [Thiothrix sp.]|nr:ferrochelatase [Thiothrix sp.]
MSRYQRQKDFFHGKAESIGVLLVNLGTPEQPETGALRRYLREFLADSRVVEIPRLIWYPILYGAILPRRPVASAAKYRAIWTDKGSPLLVIGREQQQGLQTELERLLQGPVQVELAMRYGNPSIRSALARLNEAGARRLIVLPLYPQYCAATTASTFDRVFAELGRWRWVPELRLINHYHDRPDYIAALADSIRHYWSRHTCGQLLLMSFHGIPRRNLTLGDPYFCQCRKTARLLAAALNLRPEEYRVTFQSRFGKAEWLQPYTDRTLEALPGEGIRRVDVVCPGFAADCLETLEEIQVENCARFLKAGGEAFQYIPALNAGLEHVRMLAGLVLQHAQGWPETAPDWNGPQVQKQAQLSQQLAKAAGARA